MTTNKTKDTIDFLQAHSLRELINIVNAHNKNNTEHPILKEDIVNISNEEGTYILLYYK